ncbi:nitrate regulatory gene2 protein-like [Phoenix dactylifera]|uniref:Nitrate regulatory gene2 protein-like n=1 Tax=Phoenix dactylifera TaxID=42345 RepID=A0A8B7BF76_PHODC|nr:nitrate regulatory gene2 protein-like [Phoenix dactylifera]XP_038988211.1 nitrate regulatory gene2 protein-like [Phoenix dactylifera]
MGCAQSKIENEEAVTRCKERKKWMKDAVSFRNAFAAAHSAYAVSLKNTGAALSDYALGEVPPLGHHHHPNAAAAAGGGGGSASSSAAPTAAAVVAIQPPMENLPPPPPPLPDYTPPPLQRSASLPELGMPKPKKKPLAGASIREEEDDEDAAAADDDVPSTASAAPPVSDASPAPPPPLPSQPQRSTTPPPPRMPESKDLGTWDYFFGYQENMPPPTLSQPEDTWPPAERREIEEEEIKTPATSLPPSAVGNDIRGVEPTVAPEKVVAEPVPPKAVKKPKQGGSAHHHHALSAGTSESKRGKMVAASAPPVNLLQILNELDDHFLKASESAQEVSKMLEATRMHYHSNFADNRGHIDHSARVMRVITWNRSIKGMADPDDGKDDFDNDEWETHATILDKMLAWEKKLYDEVKAGELMKIEYQRKVALLNKQKKRGVNSETLEKTKSAVSHLHTRYIVDMQSMDSTVSEINRLRDEKLYPKLVDLVDGMANMWETMHVHHGTQYKIVANLRAFDISFAPKETSEEHHECTAQLWRVVREWHSQIEKLMKNQKDYIKSLNSWLKLNLIPIESSLKEKVSSPPRPSRPPIQALLHSWNDQLEKLSDELARSAIYSFSEVVRTIVVHQEDELKMKEKCEDLRKEFMRKKRAFEDWYRKYSEKKAASGEDANPEGGEGSNQDRGTERKLEVEALEIKLKDEEEAYARLCKQVREKSLGTLRTHLPELFRNVSDFALACSEMYKKLRSVSQSLDGD